MPKTVNSKHFIDEVNSILDEMKKTEEDILDAQDFDAFLMTLHVPQNRIQRRMKSCIEYFIKLLPVMPSKEYMATTTKLRELIERYPRVLMLTLQRAGEPR